MDEGRKIHKYLKSGMLAGIFLLFGITRLWQLNVLPFAMHVDEAGMAYDAWCLSRYGVNRYLQSWPVYLRNFDGGQSALYTYLCALLFRIFGYSIWMVRLPAVIFSFLNLVFGMKLTHRIYPRREFMPMLVGGLATVCPYFILAGRFGLDCNLMLGMSTVFLYCLVAAIEDGRPGGYVLAGITGGLVLYTYALSYIIMPLFLVLMFLYLLRVKSFRLTGWIAMAVPLGTLAFPLILVQLVNMFRLEEFRLGCFTITRMSTYRAAEIGRFSLGQFRQALESIFRGDALEYNSVPGCRNLYGITIVLCALGLAAALWKLGKSLKERRLQPETAVLLWFAGILFLESHLVSNVNRINGIFFAVIFLAAEGVYTLVHICGIFMNPVWLRRAAWGIAAVVCGIYLFCFASFAVYYYGGAYTADNPMLSYFGVPFTGAIEFIEQDPQLCRKETQTAAKIGEMTVFYAIDTLISPYELAVEDLRETRFANYRFGGLGEIEEQYNYIVEEEYAEYCGQLRDAGFMEEAYDGYSLFYIR